MNIYSEFNRHLHNDELLESTIRNYMRVVLLFEKYVSENYHVRFADEGYRNLRGYMVSNWASSLSDRKFSSRTVYYIALRRFLSFLYALQYVDFDLTTALPRTQTLQKHMKLHPEERSEVRGYDPDEIGEMLRKSRGKNPQDVRRAAIIAMLSTTGLRVSELLALTVDDVAGDPQIVRVPRKGTHGAKMDVHVPSAVYPYLHAYLGTRKAPQEVRALFVTKYGNPMDRFDVYRTLKRVQDKIGAPTGCHTFRHTALTQITRQADVIVARDVANQKSVEITNRYLSATPEDMQEAVEKIAEMIRLES